MKAIVLAGGMGTRLRGVIEDIPKPMAPVGGKPFLEYLLLQLKRWKITDIVLSVGYKREIIKSYFGDGSQFGVRIGYSEEVQPLGTGGALKKAISDSDNPYFIVMNGDSFFNINFSDLITDHINRQGIMTMSLAVVSDRGRFGSVEIDDNGSIVTFQKAGPHTSGPINGGISLTNRNIINYIPEGHVSLEEYVLPLIKKDGLLYGKIFDAFFLDIGLPKDYFWINKYPKYLEQK